MITISGKNIDRDNREFPTLYDIGYSLSRLPRFNGYTIEPWTVLHHLFACWDYANARKYGPRVAFYAATHDAHEAVTGDACPPWKTDELKDLQRDLDTRFYLGLGASIPDGFTARILKQIDYQMVYAEAKAVAPQVAEHILRPGPNYREGIYTIDDEADEAVKYARGMLAPYITDANACGILYREFVTQAWHLALQREARDEDSGRPEGSEDLGREQRVGR